MKVLLFLPRRLSISPLQVCVIVSGFKTRSYAGPVPLLTDTPSLESSVMRLSQTITSVTASHAQNTVSISALSAEQVQLDERETELRDVVTRAEGKRSWFADFRDWLENVATFLDEKVPS